MALERTFAIIKPDAVKNNHVGDILTIVEQNGFRLLGMKPAVAINPHTPVELLKDILEDLYHVLIMSVNPGFGGQSFIPHTLEKVKELKKMISKTGREILIEVDGGITLENAPILVQSGADILVAGSSIFQAKDPKETIRLLKRIT